MRSEFDLINDIKSRYGLSKVGDDCAILPKNDTTDLLITSDMLVEGVDFRLEWATPEQIGHKALAVSLSDIAAMGGTPSYAMVSIAVVEKLWKGDFLDRFFAGWHDLASEYGVELIGGDISRTSGPITVDSTVLGEVAKGRAILRSGAKAGDSIYVTGTLGAAVGGLRILEGKASKRHSTAGQLTERQLKPVPQLYVGNLLILGTLATAAIDISDGLSSDLSHICDASNVGAEIHEDLIPVEPSLLEYFSPVSALALAVDGGEDFELLFTSSKPNVTELAAGIRRIGTITDKTGIVELVSTKGRTRIEPKGFRHF